MAGRRAAAAALAAACLAACCRALVEEGDQGDGLLKWWRLPDDSSGRLDQRHHSPRCCTAADCLEQDRGRHAFVTSVRSPEYLPLVRELACSLRRHSPGVPLLVIAVDGDLNATVKQEIRGWAVYREVEEFSFPNEMFARFAKNWVKLRAWGFTEYDALVMLDSDIVLQGDIRHVFDLPTDFAWVPDAGPGLHETHSGAFVFLRPCRAVAEDMLQVVREREDLRESRKFAEQSFLAWYFRYTGLRLPSMYNANFLVWHGFTQRLTAAGERPLVLHFSDRKLFALSASDPEWPYQCHRPLLAALAAQHTNASSLRGPGAAARKR